MARLNTEGHLHRYMGKSQKRSYIWKRSYARIETAVEGAIRFLMNYGQPGDLIECTRKRDGLDVATVHLMASGKVEVLWNWKEAERERASWLRKQGR